MSGGRSGTTRLRLGLRCVRHSWSGAGHEATRRLRASWSLPYHRVADLVGSTYTLVPTRASDFVSPKRRMCPFRVVDGRLARAVELRALWPRGRGFLTRPARSAMLPAPHGPPGRVVAGKARRFVPVARSFELPSGSRRNDACAVFPGRLGPAASDGGDAHGPTTPPDAAHPGGDDTTVTEPKS